MACIVASVDIKADPFFVFSLVKDIPYRTRLNPHAHVIDVVKETRGPIDVGTRFCQRQVIEGKLVEYRCWCTEYIPEQILEMKSDTNPSFKVRIIVEPIDGGVRLTQEESFELIPYVMCVPSAKGWLGKFLCRIFGNARVINQSLESLAKDELYIIADLQPKLAAWLYRIKLQLENQPAVLFA